MKTIREKYNEITWYLSFLLQKAISPKMREFLKEEFNLMQIAKIIGGLTFGFWILWELGQIINRLDLILGEL